MLYCFTGSIEQVLIIFTFFSNCTIDICFPLYWMKFAVIDDQFQLINETGTFQIMKLLQLISKAPP